MKKYLLALAIAGITVSAWAQVKSAVVSIPFAFYVGNEQLQPGKYEIKPSDATASHLTLRRVDNNDTLQVQILTRISNRGGRDAQIVFDKTEDRSYLAEIYIPGIDGFHLQGAPGRHTHTKLNQDAK
jgi:hypothetical protein